MKKIKKYQYLIGVLIQPTKEDIPVNVERYLFSAMVNNYFQAAFAEEPELENIWKEPDFSQFKKARLVEEVTEYFILDMLLDSFSHGEPYRPGFEKMDMKELDDAFRDNPFWRIFTRPMEERAVFVHEQRKAGVTQYTVADETGHLIALYHDFQPFLPFRSSIHKEVDCLIVDTPGMAIKFRVIYEGCRFPLPDNFARYYLGFRKNSGYRINIELTFDNPDGKWLKHHHRFNNQMAGFLKFFKESFSFEHFLKKYDWDNLLIQSEIFERLLTEKLPILP